MNIDMVLYLFVFSILLQSTHLSRSKLRSKRDADEDDFEEPELGEEIPSLVLKFQSGLINYIHKALYTIGKNAEKYKELNPDIDFNAIFKQAEVLGLTDPVQVQDGEALYKYVKKHGFEETKETIGEIKSNQVGNLVLMAISKQDLLVIQGLYRRNLLFVNENLVEMAHSICVETKSKAAEIIFDLVYSVHEPTLPLFDWTSESEEAIQSSLETIIRNYNFPELRRALKEGIDPNTEIKGTGSLVAASVIFDCQKCLDVLVEGGADVDGNVSYNTESSLAALRRSNNPKGWTPLMIAVAKGDKRMIEVLITKGHAKVTMPSSMDHNLHARAVARLIIDRSLSMSILQMLKPNSLEAEILKSFIQSRTVEDALKAKDFNLLDAIFCFEDQTELFKEKWIQDAAINQSIDILKIMALECPNRYDVRELKKKLLSLDDQEQETRSNLLKLVSISN